MYMRQSGGGASNLATRSASPTPNILTASKPAFVALFTATVATGTPLGICRVNTKKTFRLLSKISEMIKRRIRLTLNNQTLLSSNHNVMLSKISNKHPFVPHDECKTTLRTLHLIKNNALRPALIHSINHKHSVTRKHILPMSMILFLPRKIVLLLKPKTFIICTRRYTNKCPYLMHIDRKGKEKTEKEKRENKIFSVHGKANSEAIRL